VPRAASLAAEPPSQAESPAPTDAGDHDDWGAFETEAGKADQAPPDDLEALFGGADAADDDWADDDDIAAAFG